MVSCGDMKVGEVYVCKDCGLELEVKKSCGCPDDAACETGHDKGVCCDFECCGKPMVRKQSHTDHNDIINNSPT